MEREAVAYAEMKHHLKSAKMVGLSRMLVMVLTATALTSILSAKLSAKNPGRY